MAGHVRVAFQVDDSVAATAKLAAEPTRTPWNSLNSGSRPRVRSS